MDSRQTADELAKYAQHQKGAVHDYGTFGMLGGAMVERSNDGGVWHHGSYTKVTDGMIFTNGHYVGRASRK